MTQSDTLLEPFRAPHAPFAQHRRFERPVYVVLRDFGKLGIEGVTDPSDTRETIINGLINQQIDRVTCILEIYEGRSTDVTDDFREAVIARQAVAA